MDKVCVECRQIMDVYSIVTTKACLCAVHTSCWNNRVQLCMRAGVPMIHCSKCWSEYTVLKHIADGDPEDTPLSFKRQRLQ